jgi:predicted SAM-dependent methyltransferase
MKLNLGCGPVQPEGWVNVDHSYRARLATTLPRLDRALVRARVLSETEFRPGLAAVNLEKTLPWATDSVDAIYGGEMLEHFTEANATALLRECVRVLRPGGVLRMRVPDNATFWGNYLREYEAMRARPRSEWTDDHARWTRMFFDDICVKPRVGFFGHFHKWMFDEVSLCVAFERVGLVDVSRRAYLDSRIPDIAGVEVRDDLIVEGVKPR